MSQITFGCLINNIIDFLREWYYAVLRNEDGSILRLWIDEDGCGVRVECEPYYGSPITGGTEDFYWDDELCDNICDEFGIKEESTGWLIDPETIRELKRIQDDTVLVLEGMERIVKNMKELNEGENNG